MALAAVISYITAIRSLGIPIDRDDTTSAHLTRFQYIRDRLSCCTSPCAYIYIHRDAVSARRRESNQNSRTREYEPVQTESDKCEHSITNRMAARLELQRMCRKIALDLRSRPCYAPLRWWIERLYQFTGTVCQVP